MGLTREQLGPAARAEYDRQMALRVQNAIATATPPAPSAIAQRVRKGIKSSKQDAVEFLNICERAQLPKPELEFVFHPTRKWRFDYAWPKYKLALEVDGGVFIGGAHNSGRGFLEDHEKLNSAAVIGWRVLKVQPKDILKFETVDMVARAMKGRCI